MYSIVNYLATGFEESKMFSKQEKQMIAAAVEKFLLEINHPEMPNEKPSFKLHVDGKESWSWADIEPNWKYEVNPPSMNHWNENARSYMRQDDKLVISKNTIDIVLKAIEPRWINDEDGGYELSTLDMEEAFEALTKEIKEQEKQMDTRIVETKDGKNYNQFGEQVISCAICDEGTTMLGTEHCDRCHELDKRIQCNLDIAERLVNYYRSSQ